MKLFIETPVWLGDAIMASVAIKNIIEHFKGAQIILFGSFAAMEVYKEYEGVSRVIVDESKKSSNRWAWLYTMSKEVGKCDIALSFRRQWSTKFLLLCLSATQKMHYKRLSKESIHQVKRYNDFASHALHVNFPLGDLYLPFKAHSYERPTLGLNPGATYGSAKRWYPEEFAKVAIALHERYNIVIFGGPSEVDIAREIEELIRAQGIENVENIAGKTSIQSLCEHIGGLELFITNDSGPLHIAAAYKVKTIAIFGPTISTETHGWNNPYEKIIKLNLPCQPCMKRTCPLGHHACMKGIDATMILKEIQ
ncbi:glycosyltransferase family 9 protein [Sulfurospirillum barnesii]|uniref:ADP-heptose:LPS heptosyltransferase n=1 Tax=Sulfurospirillum barnesii (strain ATCC 700032 / DSM 10660 / SES-3) TaxID=760154 RepID=I3XYZ7_SULBS|nr:glycosyltransferase family 9 protein [Sulfurospirillum barnesii]AFL69171.1 ADP-heptose:LPS heptosyltransferase [Sulfurospirillum barnesii SES-3]